MDSEQPMVVVVIDAHHLVRLGMRTVLDGMSDMAGKIVVLEADGVEDAERVVAARGGEVNLCIIDPGTPGNDARAGLAAVVGAWPATPVVQYSVLCSTQAVRDAFQGGAMGFIPKSMASRLIPHALRLVLDGGRYIPVEILDAIRPNDLVRSSEPRRHGSLGPGAALGHLDPQKLNLCLTARQLEVLKLMGDGLSNKEISRCLNISVGTAKNHVAAILQLLGVANRASAVGLLYGAGIPGGDRNE